MENKHEYCMMCKVEYSSDFVTELKLYDGSFLSLCEDCKHTLLKNFLPKSELEKLVRELEGEIDPNYILYGFKHGFCKGLNMAIQKLKTIIGGK